VTYIQTDYEDQPIKLEPADIEFCAIHLKKPAVNDRHYTIVPGEPSQMPADYDCIKG
jgi:hypothetical protein